MAPIDALIFDLDGVMVDTEPISQAAWNTVLKPFDVALSEEICGRIIGHRSDQCACIIKTALHLSIDPGDLLRRKKEAFNRLLAHDIPVMPGLRRMVDKLSDHRIAWAVATSSPSAYARKILRRIGLWEQCSAMATGDEVCRSKPAPDVYLLAAQRLGASPGRCLALEDSLPECQAAVAAGMVTVAVSNHLTKRESLDFVKQTYSSLIEAADRLDHLIH
jgi:HAD superfamily hydrolase (TIGR01509 family)